MKKFEHDCTACKYLGSTHGLRHIDWYRCNDTVIGRFSSDGPDYFSTTIDLLDRIAAGDKDGEFYDLGLLAIHMLKNEDKQNVVG